MRWNWAWTPFVFIGTAAIANAVMIVTSTRVRPQHVSANPFVESQRFDEDHAAEGRFRDQGLDIAARIAPGQVTLTLSGPQPDDLRIAAYRPSDAALDQRLVWADPGQNLILPLQAGLWRLTVSGETVDGPVRMSRMLTIP